jgi:hypothetical protein
LQDTGQTNEQHTGRRRERGQWLAPAPRFEGARTWRPCMAKPRAGYPGSRQGPAEERESTVSDHRPGSHGDGGGRETKPVPRDMPDQQAGADEDPWEPDGDSAQPAQGERPDPDIPDTDEAGTGRRGSPHSGSPRPEHPVPDEPSG